VVSCAKKRHAVWNEDSDGPKESCIRWKSTCARDVAMATNFGTKMAIAGFVRTIATRQLVMEGF